jgi:hypothetical protein
MSLLQRISQGGGTPSTPPGQPPRPLPTGNPFNLGGPRPNSRVQWEIIPTADVIVKFDLNALDPDLFSLAGLPAPEMPASAGDQDAATPAVPLGVRLAEALENNPEAEATLKRVLDQAWSAHELTGAALIYGWREEARAALVARLEAQMEPTVILRAADPVLVLNVLSRARTHILIANAPPALERAFLERTLFSDDPRLAAMAQASGVVEEPLVEPQPEAEDSADDETS